VPGCQKLQVTAYPGLAQDALQLYTWQQWALKGFNCQRRTKEVVLATSFINVYTCTALTEKQ